MGVIVGFIIGYILGTRNGPLDLDEINEAWEDIRNSEEAQAVVAGGADIVLQMIQKGLGILGQVALKR
jgi:hypothetical protein